MVVKMFSVYDSKVEAYLQPVFLQSKGAMLRAIEQSVNASVKDSHLAASPQDFTVFEIGEFDDSTGTISMYPAKVSLGCAVEFLKPVKS